MHADTNSELASRPHQLPLNQGRKGTKTLTPDMGLQLLEQDV